VIAQEAVIALPKTKISVAVIERPKIGIRSSRVIVTVAPAKTDPRTLLDAELQRWTIRTERPRALTGALIVRIGNLLIWITKIVVAAIAWRNGLLTERPCGSYRQREYARCTQANGQLKLHQSKRHDPPSPIEAVHCRLSNLYDSRPIAESRERACDQEATLFEYLAAIDIKAVAATKKNPKQNIARGLEVCCLTLGF
jgi:hypothetical protein